MKDKQTTNQPVGLNINWFPGHMKKGTDQIIANSNQVDMIIEVVDARAIYSSSNYELLNQIAHKPVLTIALKSDYSSLTTSPSPNILLGSIKDKNFRQVVINKINEMLHDKIARAHKKGILKPKFSLMVVGLPNLGKSSLINFLKNKKVLVAKNMPGVTRNQNLVAINDTLYLIDTPGILLKRIDDIETAYKLVLINAIKKDVLVLEHVLKYGFEYYQANHLNSLLNYYHLDHVNDYEDFVNQVCQQKHWITTNGQNDINRFEDQIFNDFSLNKICKVNFDK